MKPPYKESTFSEVDGFGGSDMSDISEEALECESDSEEQDTYNSYYRNSQIGNGW